MNFLRPFCIGFLTAAALANLIVASVVHRSVGVAWFWLVTFVVGGIYAFVLARQIEKNEHQIAALRVEYIERLEREARIGYRWSSTHAQPERPS